MKVSNISSVLSLRLYKDTIVKLNETTSRYRILTGSVFLDPQVQVKSLTRINTLKLNETTSHLEYYTDQNLE